MSGGARMDETVYKIALAGYLHDIGKFAERAYGVRGSAIVFTQGIDRFIFLKMDAIQFLL